MRKLATALMLTGLLAAPAGAQDANASARRQQVDTWELDVFGGYGRLDFPATETVEQNGGSGGPAFALSAAYRGPHFTHPFVDLAYVPMLSSHRTVYLPDGSVGGRSASASNSSWAFSAIVGPGWDIDWFRLRLGVGLYDLTVRSSLLGHTNSTSKLSIGFLVALGAMVWRAEPFAVGIEARLSALQAPTLGVYQSSWSLGITGRWDINT